jgi:hypothetical protein
MLKRILVGLTLISTTVIAQPVYLECSGKNKADESFSFSSALDEATKKVTHTTSKDSAFYQGSSYNIEGFWSANSIAYSFSKTVDGMRFSEQVKINRSTLNFEKQSSIKFISTTLDVPARISNATGTCQIVEVTTRKF